MSEAAATKESLGPYAPLLAPPGTGAPLTPPPPSTLVGAGESDVEVLVEVWFALLAGLVELELELEAFPDGVGGLVVKVTVVSIVATAVVVWRF